MAHPYLSRSAPPLAQTTEEGSAKYLDQVVEAAKKHSPWWLQTNRPLTVEVIRGYAHESQAWGSVAHLFNYRVQKGQALMGRYDFTASTEGAISEFADPREDDTASLHSGATQSLQPPSQLSTLADSAVEEVRDAALAREYGELLSRGLSPSAPLGAVTRYTSISVGAVVTANAHHPYDDRQAFTVAARESAAVCVRCEPMRTLEKATKHPEAHLPSFFFSKGAPMPKTIAAVDFAFAQRFLIDFETLSRHDIIVDFYVTYPTCPIVGSSVRTLPHHTKSRHAAAPRAPVRKSSPPSSSTLSITTTQSVSALNESHAAVDASGTSAGEWHRFRLVFQGALWCLILYHHRQLLVCSLKRDVEAILPPGAAVEVYSLYATGMEMELILGVRTPLTCPFQILDALSRNSLSEAGAMYSALALFLSQERPSTTTKPMMSSRLSDKKTTPAGTPTAPSVVVRASNVQHTTKVSLITSPSVLHMYQTDTTSSTMTSPSFAGLTSDASTVYRLLKLTTPLLFQEEDSVALHRLIDRAPSELRSALRRDAMYAMPQVNKVQVHYWAVQSAGLYVELVIRCLGHNNAVMTSNTEMAIDRCPFTNTWDVIRAYTMGPGRCSVTLPMIMNPGVLMPGRVPQSQQAGRSVMTITPVVPTTTPASASQAKSIPCSPCLRDDETRQSCLLLTAPDYKPSDHTESERITEHTIDTVQSIGARNNASIVMTSSFMVADSRTVSASSAAASSSYTPSVRSLKERFVALAPTQTPSTLVSVIAQGHVEDSTRTPLLIHTHPEQSLPSTASSPEVKNTGDFGASSATTPTSLLPPKVHSEKDTFLVAGALEQRVESFAGSTVHPPNTGTPDIITSESTPVQALDLVVERTEEETESETAGKILPLLPLSQLLLSSTSHLSEHLAAVEEVPLASRVPCDARALGTKSLWIDQRTQVTPGSAEAARCESHDSIEPPQPLMFCEKHPHVVVLQEKLNAPLNHMAAKRLLTDQGVQRDLHPLKSSSTMSVLRMHRAHNPVLQRCAVPTRGSLDASAKVVIISQPEVLSLPFGSAASQPKRCTSLYHIEPPDTTWERLSEDHCNDATEAVMADIDELPGSARSDTVLHTMSFGDNGSLEVHISVPAAALPLKMSTQHFNLAMERLPLLLLRELHQAAAAYASMRFHFRRFFFVETLTEERLAGGLEMVRSLFIAETCAALGTSDNVVERVELSGHLTVDATVRVPSSRLVTVWRSVLMKNSYPQLNELLRELAIAGTPKSTPHSGVTQHDSLLPTGASIHSLTVNTAQVAPDGEDKGASIVGVRSGMLLSASPLHAERLRETHILDTTTAQTTHAVSVHPPDALTCDNNTLSRCFLQGGSADFQGAARNAVDHSPSKAVRGLRRRFHRILSKVSGPDVTDTTCTLRLDGVAWKQVVERHSDSIAETFVEEALQCLRSHYDTTVLFSVSVKTLEVDSDGLVIAYDVASTVSSCHVDRRRIQDVIMEYAFPQLWRVYDSFMLACDSFDQIKNPDWVASRRLGAAYNIETPRQSEYSQTISAQEMSQTAFEANPKTFTTDEETRGAPLLSFMTTPEMVRGLREYELNHLPAPFELAKPPGPLVTSSVDVVSALIDYPAREVGCNTPLVSSKKPEASAMPDGGAVTAEKERMMVETSSEISLPPPHPTQVLSQQRCQSREQHQRRHHRRHHWGAYAEHSQHGSQQPVEELAIGDEKRAPEYSETASTEGRYGEDVNAAKDSTPLENNEFVDDITAWPLEPPKTGYPAPVLSLHQQHSAAPLDSTDGGPVVPTAFVVFTSQARALHTPTPPVKPKLSASTLPEEGLQSPPDSRIVGAQLTHLPKIGTNVNEREPSNPRVARSYSTPSGFPFLSNVHSPAPITLLGVRVTHPSAPSVRFSKTAPSAIPTVSRPRLSPLHPSGAAAVLHTSPETTQAERAAVSFPKVPRLSSSRPASSQSTRFTQVLTHKSCAPRHSSILREPASPTSALSVPPLQTTAVYPRPLPSFIGVTTECRCILKGISNHVHSVEEIMCIHYSRIKHELLLALKSVATPDS